MSRLIAAWQVLFLHRPVLVLLLFSILLLGFASQAPRFSLDASSDALLLEDDADLRFYREIRARYGSDDFLVVTYSRPDLFSDEALADLEALRDALAGVERIASVISILDVPLIQSPPITLTELQELVPDLLHPRTDRALARRELMESPIYRELLISLDGRTTGLLATFAVEPELQALLAGRDRLLEARMRDGPDEARERDIARLSAEIAPWRAIVNARQQADIVEVRKILARHADQAEISLGGIPMINSDMLDYIMRDVLVFGAAILLVLTALLVLIFRQVRWVLLPLISCFACVIIMLGYLGMADWPVTVVSANFVALLLIFTLSLTVHLMVQYRELQTAERISGDRRRLVAETLRRKFAPSFFTAVTTMVAFASLLVSGIRPVIDFGWMMVVGMAVVLVLSFTLFPAALLVLPGGPPAPRDDRMARVTRTFARLVTRWPRALIAVFGSIAVLGLAGVAQLSVENRFIDYFSESTEIHRGMATIDRELGGTTPLDVILDADSAFMARLAGETGDASEPLLDDDDDFFDDYDLGEAAGLGATSFWYNTFRLETVRAVHEYLESLPETGKVLSLATTLDVLRTLNQGEELDTFFLSVLYERLPQEIRAALFDPYLSADGNQVRLAVRVRDSNPDLRRAELLTRIRADLGEGFELEPGQVRLTGMLVLYNNVLQSLFRSQILTVGVVFLAILLMLLLLFRSPVLAAIALVPNMLAALAVLGGMGWAGIPLDIMTITIAAIAIGIGVDGAIHYVHRFRAEFAQRRDYLVSIERAHQTTGRAMYYTALIIAAGFATLTLSNFIPTIYFGLFTAFAMLFAMVANLTLLPLLLLRVRPLGEPGPRSG
ncbi:MAG: MMPL family transporter [Chromatiales bacterium]|nr:MMPL family transporter [Chromatiales bacterium]